MANYPGGPAGPAPLPTSPSRGAEPRLNPPAGSPAPGSSGRRAVVGPASAMRGQLSAREDLWIEGQFDGEIKAAGHQVTVSTGGRVRAEVKARSVVVEGELIGNVVAEQMVTVRAGGRMQGDIRSPRVGLEEGCQFQGNVDMDGTQVEAPAVEVPAANATGAGEPTPAPAGAPAMVGEGGS